MKSKLKECMAYFISDVKGGKNPVLRAEDMLVKNSDHFTRVQEEEVEDEDDE